MKPSAELTVYVKNSSSTHPLPAGSCLQVGRGSRVHVRVDDPSVSREHLLIHVGATIEVEDLGSSNGTEIFPVGKGAPTVGTGGQNLLVPGRRYALSPGDMLRIGSVPALFQVEEPTNTSYSPTIPPAPVGGPVLLDPEMRRIYELAARAAQSDIGVLINGETGSGKELLAEAVHKSSRRSNKPLLKVNCGAIAENLLESELFGHERGAFTGAHTARPGLFEATEGGTVFMDEIGEMPLGTQVKLLRLLEERQVRRVGASKTIPVNVRFIAATNRDLQAEVAAGRFRGDLYYRLSGIVLKLPPLRERPSEIEPLARHFLRQFCVENRISVPLLTPAAISAMMAYPWPGNVRELKNVVERAPFLTNGAPIGPEHIPRHELLDEDAFPDSEKTDVRDLPRLPWQHDQAARRVMEGAHGNVEIISLEPVSVPRIVSSTGTERERVLEALRQAEGNQTRAASLLGVSRRTLINRLESFGLPRPRKRGE